MDVLEKIRKLRLERNWTEYQLAEKSGLTQSTISTWYRKNISPTIPSLEKICFAFNISMAQFFTEPEFAPTILTEPQARLVHHFNRMNEQQQDSLLQFLTTI